MILWDSSKLSSVALFVKNEKHQSVIINKHARIDTAAAVWSSLGPEALSQHFIANQDKALLLGIRLTISVHTACHHIWAIEASSRLIHNSNQGQYTVEPLIRRPTEKREPPNKGHLDTFPYYISSFIFNL